MRLTAGSKPREFCDGVDIARRALGGGRDFQLRASHASTIGDIDFALAQPHLFVLLPPDIAEGVSGRRFIEEDRDRPIPRCLRKRIGREHRRHLCRGADDDADGLAGVDLQAQTKKIPGKAPDDVKKRADLRIAAGKKFDEAIPYFEKVDQDLGTKGKLKMDEKTSLKDAYDLLITIYEQKKIQDKMDAYTAKFNSVDKDH